MLSLIFGLGNSRDPSSMIRKLALILCAGAAMAQSTHEPLMFEFGFEARVRTENWNNPLDYSDRLDDEREQMRYRTRAWMKAPLSSTVDFFVGLNHETTQRFGQKNQFDEVVFESAYIDFRRVFTDGLALRVGRQNLSKGEGFILFDGTAGDGSRTFYFNAVNLSYTRGRSSIDLLGILNPRSERFLPTLHDRSRHLSDWDERALGAYYTHASGFEGYYFYKRETNAFIPPSSGRFQPDRHVHTLGGRVVRKPRPAWTATGEFAGQWGSERPSSTIRAWGGYAHLRRSFDNRPWKPYLLGGYWAMSGDDPSTPDRVEGWDPLFSRWPKWSELYIYSLSRELGSSYWSNLAMWQAEAGASPLKWLDLRLNYFRMNAFYPFPGDSRVFGEGTRRGDKLFARADFTINRNWRGHALFESMLPGNFYRGQNTGVFVRFEIIYTITGSVAADDLKLALKR